MDGQTDRWTVGQSDRRTDEKTGRRNECGWCNFVSCTGCSLNVVFYLKIFLNSASSAATALVFDLPLCTLSDTEGKNRARPESGIYFKIFKKNTIFNEDPVFDTNPPQTYAPAWPTTTLKMIY